MNKPYRLPNEIKISRVIAEDVEMALKNMFRYESASGCITLSEMDRKALETFLELMEDKTNRTVEYLKSRQ